MLGLYSSHDRSSAGSSSLLVIHGHDQGNDLFQLRISNADGITDAPTEDLAASANGIL